MKKTILITIALFLCFFGQAQFLDNKINVYIGYDLGTFHGKETVEQGSFLFPSLYSNYKNLNGLSFKCMVKGNQFYSLGLGFSTLNASNWETSKARIYNESSIKQYSISPTVQLHNKFEDSGIFNRFRMFFNIAPGIGLSELSLEKSLFDIHPREGTISQTMDSRDLFYSIGGDVGFELAVTRTFGIYFTYSLQHNWVKSKIYIDTQFSNSLFGFGLVFKFKNDKYLYY